MFDTDLCLYSTIDTISVFSEHVNKGCFDLICKHFYMPNLITVLRQKGSLVIYVKRQNRRMKYFKVN